MVWDKKKHLPQWCHLCRSSRTLALRRMRSAWVTSWDEAWWRGIWCVIDVSKGNVEHKLMRLLNEIWDYCGFEANSFWAPLLSDISVWIADLKKSCCCKQIPGRQLTHLLRLFRMKTTCHLKDHGCSSLAAHHSCFCFPKHLLLHLPQTH